MQVGVLVIKYLRFYCLIKQVLGPQQEQILQNYVMIFLREDRYYLQQEKYIF